VQLIESRTTRVVVLSAILMLAGLAGCTLQRPGSLVGTAHIPWWAFVVIFGVTEAFVLKVRVHGQLEGVSLSEIPLAIGLFMAADPGHVILARMLMGGFVFVFLHKHSPIKALLNVSLCGASTAAAFAVFDLLVGSTHQAMGPAGWAAVPLGVTLTGLLEGAVLVLVIDWYSGERRPAGEVLRELAFSFLIPVTTAMIGLVTVYALHSGAAVLPLAVTGCAALGGYRAFAGLSDRHASLERLSELSAALAVAPGSQDVVTSVLGQSMDLMRAEFAEVALAGWSGEPLRWSLRQGGPVQGPHAGSETSLAYPPPGIVVIKSDDAVHASLLVDRSLSEALVVPLRVDDEVAGYILVGDRRSEERPFNLSDGRLLETVANHASVALRNGRLMERLHFEARHDELTGLPNRLDLRDRLDEAATLAATGQVPVSVLVLDFDGFKAINDTLGHQAGDELLRILAGRFSVKAGDDAMVARLGGDEFAVLSNVCTTAEESMELALRLLSSFEEPVSVGGTRLRLGGSLGIALGPRDGTSGSDLLRNADIAMYAAKTGAGGARLFSQDLVEVTASTLTLASDLRDAVSQQDISVAVQPLVDLDTGVVHSVEVLARWTHPELGEIPPEAFFSAAERSGQITALSARVLDQALAWCSTWNRAGKRIRVAVNLAPRWLADDSLPEQIQASLTKHDVPAHLLCLEITESSVIADPRRAILTLTRLRAMGVHLSVDDFGTGYSSLTYLSRLPVDQMKIDKSFVSRLHDSARDRAIVRSIIDLGRNLSLEVVAEGVTDPGTRRALQEMGCSLGQGYLFSKPMDPEELLAHLRQHGLTDYAGMEREPRPEFDIANQLPAQMRKELPGRAPAPPSAETTVERRSTRPPRVLP
jgi:diguanylate cyclase (GGDEF)-like protein